MPILHSVFFYFQEDVDPAEAERQQAAVLQDLSQIGSVSKIWAGAPVGIDRDVVDNTYTTSLHAIFEDRAGLDAYQTDPIHLNFLQTFRANWKSVRVFDTRV